MKEVSSNAVLLENEEEAERAEQLARTQPPSEPTQFPSQPPQILSQLRKEFS